MSLPTSRNTTYVATDVPSIKAADLNALQDWLVDAYLGKLGYWGDGSDGNVTLDGVTDYNTFSSRASTTYTLNRDVFAGNLTVDNAITLRTNGYRVYVRGTLLVSGSGVLVNEGFTVGTAGVANVLSGGGAGGAAGAAGGAVTGFGGNGGAGGGAGGAGGAVTAPLAKKGSIRAYSPAALGALIGDGGVTFFGGGGGGGGGEIAGGGVGGGGGGGVVAVAARILQLNGSSSLFARGGNGQGGTNAGGGGGGGVVVVFFAHNVNGTVFSAAASCPGGTGGSGTNPGSAGSNGQIFAIQLLQQS